VKASDDRPLRDLQNLSRFPLRRPPVPNKVDHQPLVTGESINGGMKCGPSLQRSGFGGPVRLGLEHVASIPGICLVLGGMTLGAKVMSGKIDKRSTNLRGGKAKELFGRFRSNL